ncbi:MAG: SPOR domain-containing protein [Deltaproteobacteria bacterium]|nr:SPOR domain-containing protein [Deltaproteobacteria bacterium]
MKRIILTLVIVFIALPLWADFGVSNVVTKEIKQLSAPAIEPALGAEYVKTSFYPYTIHLSSWQDPNVALSQVEKNEDLISGVFITKIDLGSSGIWYRVDYGIFQTIKEAVLFLRELQEQKTIDEGAFVGSSVPYTIEINVFDSREKAFSEASRLKALGIATYLVEENEKYYRVLFGAYPDMNSARLAHDDLYSLGLKPKITKR